jgi:hypothetical protein
VSALLVGLGAGLLVAWAACWAATLLLPGPDLPARMPAQRRVLTQPPRKRRDGAPGAGRGRLLRGAPLPRRLGGQALGLPPGRQAATGEWLVFLDADVRLAPEALALLLGDAEANRAQSYHQRGLRPLTPPEATPRHGAIPLGRGRLATACVSGTERL